MNEFLFSRGRNINDKRPARIAVDGFAGFVRYVDGDRATKTKDGAHYYCGAVGEGTRCAAGVLPRGWLAVDLDKIDPDRYEAVWMWFAKFEAFGWPTHSSTRAAPRARVVIRLDRDATRAECIAAGAALSQELHNEFGDAIMCDPSTYRGEQPIYGPPPRVALRTFDGDALAVDRYVAKAPVPTPRANGTEHAVTAIHDGVELHETLLRLTAQWAGKGMERDAIRAAAVVLLDGARAARGNERIDRFIRGGELARIIDGAVGKYAPPEASINEDHALPALFVDVDLSQLGKAVQEPQKWLLEGYIPAGHVTLLGGHGGAGKSVLALMLAACVAVGRPFLGKQTKQCRVLYFSGEDSAGLVLARLVKICHALKIDLAPVRQNLRVLDATDADPALFIERRLDGVRAGVTTPTYQALAEYVDAHAIEFVIADNASDVFDGDEINRALVRGFMRALVRLVKKRNGAALLLAHVDKMTSRLGKSASSESYSGSTAWHNSARSRLFLLEKEAGMLVLQHQKCNLGPKMPDLSLEWPIDGLPQPAASSDAAVKPGSDLADTRALLNLLHEFFARGEYVTAATSTRGHAAKLLCGQATYPAHRKDAEVFDLLRNAERDGYISRHDYKTIDRKPHERWELTPKGCDWLGVAPTAPTVPTSNVKEAGAAGAEGAPSVPTSAWGVRGVRAHTQSAHEDGATGNARAEP